MRNAYEIKKGWFIYMQKSEITVKLHYSRPDGDFSGWNAWMWTLTKGGRDYAFEQTETDRTATMVVDGYTTTCINFIVRKGMWEAQEFAERQIDVSTVLGGTVHCFITSGVEAVKVILGDDVVIANKLLASELNYDQNTIAVKTSMEVSNPEAFRILDISGEDVQIAITGIQGGAGEYQLALNKPLDLVYLYRYQIAFGNHNYSIQSNTVYASKRFSQEFTYAGDDLGAVWTQEKTAFKLWAPTAEQVRIALYRTGDARNDDRIDTVNMARGDRGVWSADVQGDCNGLYYTYLVTVSGKQVEAVDPYARTTGVNGDRGMVIDLKSTDPCGWEQDKNPNPLKSYTDAVLYELHVRDFSIDPASGISEANRGKFLGLTEQGTKSPAGVPTGLDYLKSLGITHLHLLPIYDYGSVDETRLDEAQFNWGYDPVNYNTPDGSYSTDPYNGAVRVNELKQAVKALHDNGISVVMDVVYNHVFEAGNFCFNKIVPGYFSRSNPDGSFSNGSGCGNDTASERPMVRKFIVDSIVYWQEQYHLDGFRFDLVGLLDATTINALVDAVHANRPDVIFYGEGWTMNTAVEPGNFMATQLNAHMTPEFAYFSDTIRDLLAGRNGETLGFVSGLKGKEEPLAHCFTATTSWCPSPNQTVNYASCHDNYTLADKLSITRGDATVADRTRMNRLAAAIYMTAQGIPFIHAGEEFLREKLDENGKRIENSYNSSDFVNKIRWELLEDADHAAVTEYYRGLIRFRKAHAALRLSDAKAVAENVTYKWITNELVLFDIRGSESITDEISKRILVIFNATTEAKEIDLTAHDIDAAEWSVYVNDRFAGTEVLDTVTDGKVTVPPISALVLAN